MLALDLEVSDFQNLTNLALVPFAVFVAFLLAALTTLTVVFARMWRAQVRLMVDVDRQKDELLGMIAHQLAAPVTAVGWAADGLLGGDDGPLTDSQRADVRTIRSVAAQLGELVGMILDVSRVQLGKVPISDTPLDVLAVLRVMLEVVRIQAREKGCVSPHPCFGRSRPTAPARPARLRLAGPPLPPTSAIPPPACGRKASRSPAV
ncbi:HAMP domain-containing histidine kinase [bacterium]|nr:HAMP domain-containing histidine kinase [bacterium]